MLIYREKKYLSRKSKIILPGQGNVVFENLFFCKSIPGAFFIVFFLNNFFSGGIERNISLTITNVKSADQGDYNCVAINQGGMAEKNITLTFAHPNTWPGNKIKNN